MASPDVGGSTVYTSVAMSVLDQKHFYSTQTSTLLMGSWYWFPDFDQGRGGSQGVPLGTPLGNSSPAYTPCDLIMPRYYRLRTRTRARDRDWKRIPLCICSEMTARGRRPLTPGFKMMGGDF